MPASILTFICRSVFVDDFYTSCADRQIIWREMLLVREKLVIVDEKGLRMMELVFVLEETST